MTACQTQLVRHNSSEIAFRVTLASGSMESTLLLGCLYDAKFTAHSFISALKRENNSKLGDAFDLDILAESSGPDREETIVLKQSGSSNSYHALDGLELCNFSVRIPASAWKTILWQMQTLIQGHARI